MVHSRIRRRWLLAAGAMLVAFAIGSSCQVAGTGGSEPEVATLILLFPGDDSVIVDIASGDVLSGPITIFGNVDFTAQFFAEDGTPDERVTDARFRLDVTPANTAIVTFTRAASFSGSFNKIANGETEVMFALVNIAAARNEFARSAPISVN